MIETKKVDASGVWYKTGPKVAYPLEDPGTGQRIDLGVVTKVSETDWVKMQAAEGVLIKTNEDGEPVDAPKVAVPAEKKADPKTEPAKA